MPVPPDDSARLLRRLDWRFLLPEPRLRRVLHVGPPASTLARALERYSESMVAAGRSGTHAEADLVVAEGASDREVETAISSLSPDGSLYWELRRGRTIRPADLHWLARAGITQVHAVWHCAGFEDRRWLIPLDNPAGLAMLLKRRFPGAAPMTLSAVARVLARSHTVRRTLAIGVIGCRGVAAHSSFAQRFVDAQCPRTLESASTPSSPAFVVATPSFPSSRSVVFLMNPGRSAEPTLVAKIARVPAGDDAHAREARVLRAVEAAGATVDHAPRLVAHDVFERHSVLVETGLAGRMMQPRFVRSRPGPCIEMVLEWLEGFHRATRTCARHDSRQLVSLVESPLARLESIVQAEPGGPSLVDHTRRVTSCLGLLNVPLVFEHGDLSSPNLVVLAGGRAGVLDWELGEPRGLPAVDLFFFLAFIAFARERAASPDRCVSAFRRAFFGREAWARPYVLRYAAAVGVPQAALAPLFLLCWSRYLAGLADRVQWSGGDSSVTTLAEVRRNRYWHLWKYAAEHDHELRYAV